MRTGKTVRLGVSLAAVLLIASSATMNARYGYWLGQDTVSRWTWVIASVASDIGKALTPLILLTAVRDRDWFKGAAALLLIVVTVPYSAAAAIGFAANTRAKLISTNQGQIDRYDQARSNARQAAAEMERISAHRRWHTTAGCSDATVPRSRQFCAVNAPLYARAETQLAEAKAALARGKPAAADAQLEAIAAFLGHSTNQVQGWLVWLAALLVEIGSLVGLLVGSTAKRRPEVIIAKHPTRLNMTDALDWLLGNEQLVLSNRQLGTQWGVSHATAGRWINEFVEQGHVHIEYEGKNRRIIAN